MKFFTPCFVPVRRWHALLSALLAAGGFGLWGSPVAAHQGFSPGKVNRYATLLVGREKLQFHYAVFIGRLPALVLRRRHDRNRDGRLSPSELAAMTREVEVAVRKDVALTLDGRALEFAPGRIRALQGNIQQVRPVPLLLSGTWEWNLEPSRHEVRYVDRLALGPIGERHVRIATAPGVHLLESHAGSWAQGPRRMFSFQGPPTGIEDRSITVAFQNETPDTPTETPRKRPGSASLLALLACLVGLVTAAFLLLRRRRSGPGEE